MYLGTLSAVIIVTTYCCLWAVVGSFTCSSLFGFKPAACVVSGAVLGIPLSAPFFAIGQTMGFAAMGASIAFMWVLFYTGLIPFLIRLIPERIRKVIRTVLRILGFLLIIAIIILVVVMVMKFWTT